MTTQIKTSKPKILVARAIFPEALAKLEESFEVRSNQEDQIFTPAELKKELSSVVGALVTGSERIDAETLSEAPNLKIVANIAVGYNNFDIPSISAAGVMATNTPDVLTDTTADFGFALLMATARRITESEHWLRAGNGISGLLSVILWVWMYTTLPLASSVWVALVRELPSVPLDLR